MYSQRGFLIPEMVAAIILALLATTIPTLASGGYTAIDTSKLQKYLVDATIINRNESSKYIVNTLWVGLTQVMNRKLKDDVRGMDEICLNALDSYIDAVLNKQELWALKMYDASSGTQPGFLTGNIQDLGSYDECVEISNPSEPPLNGKYCMVLVKENKTAPLVIEKSITGVSVSYALCIPSVCDAEQLEYILNQGVAVSSNQTLPLSVDEEECYGRERRALHTSDWLAILFFGTLIALAIFSTFYELYRESSSMPTKLESMLLSFSLWRNTRQLLSVSTNRDSMGCLFGLRFLMIVWIICVHRFSQLRAVPAMSMFQHHRLIQDWTRAPIVNGYISVDGFFVISGTLLSYSFARKITHYRQSFSLIKFYLHRYLRLTPAFAGLILFYATLSDFCCEGPMCKLFSDTIKSPCVKNWWTSLLYINNHYDSDVMCVVQSWYLSVDMQLFLLSPILLYPMIYKPKILPHVLACFYGVAVAVSMLQPYFNHVSAGYFIVGKHEDHRIFLDNYVMTYTRAGSWLMGFALGIYLDECKRNPKPIPGKLIAVGWLTCLAALAGVIFGILPFQQEDHVYSEVWDTLYKSLHRHVWAAAICWIVFACSIGRGGFINSLLSWRPVFQPLGKLTYCIYLVHILILKVQMGAQRTPVNFSDITRVTIFFGDVVASTIAATVLYLLLEAPGCSLDRLFLGSETGKKVKVETAESGMELPNKPSS